MKRPGLLPQIGSGVTLGLLVALDAITVALPILFIRFIVAVAVDGVTWKHLEK